MIGSPVDFGIYFSLNEQEIAEKRNEINRLANEILDNEKQDKDQSFPSTQASSINEKDIIPEKEKIPEKIEPSKSSSKKNRNQNTSKSESSEKEKKSTPDASEEQLGVILLGIGCGYVLGTAPKSLLYKLVGIGSISLLLYCGLNQTNKSNWKTKLLNSNSLYYTIGLTLGTIVGRKPWKHLAVMSGSKDNIKSF